MKFIIINGPNINILEKRKIYGNNSFQDIKKTCLNKAEELKIKLDFFQSNHEGEIVEFIQKINGNGIVINAAAYSHTSIAIMDTLITVNQPIVEVHISNIFSQEKFRRYSYISQIAHAVISGTGITGYRFAIEYLYSLQKDKAYIA
ncbi:MAG: 3-dehydroquinate dehydratase [Rickettsiaceae bacterium H1]|nr:3-dehydroquinate dehydratase [Rickettsiaceae bacterium H1]